MKSLFRSILPNALVGTLAFGCAVSSESGHDGSAAASDALTLVSCPLTAQCFVVTNTSDGGAGSLRQAIIDANASTSAQRIIKFDIPGAGPHVIQPVQYLPVLQGKIKIDGFTQPGTAPATDTTPPEIEIVINGLFCTGFCPWGLNLEGDDNEIRGVAINDFKGSGIVINSNRNVVRGNMLGVDRDATFARPNTQAAININSGSENTIGGGNIADRNVASGNGVQGLYVYTGGNIIQGNAIGTNFDGSVGIPNGDQGILLDGDGGNEIGGTGEGEGNIIAWNGGNGVTVSHSSENTLARNAIFGNGGLAIDLDDDGVTRNDGLLDPDSGANERQNFPHPLAVTLDPATLYEGKYKATLDWQLKSEANTKYRVEFFASSSCDASGRGEAERSLGLRAINTDPTGLVENTWTLPGRVFPGEVITATATKFVRVGTEYVATSTSELSRCLQADLCSGTSCGTSAPPDDDE